MADHHLPRPLEVVILAISTFTETSGHPLAQFFTLFLPVLIVFAAKESRAIAMLLACACGCVRVCEVVARIPLRGEGVRVRVRVSV